MIDVKEVIKKANNLHYARYGHGIKSRQISTIAEIIVQEVNSEMFVLLGDMWIAMNQMYIEIKSSKESTFRENNIVSQEFKDIAGVMVELHNKIWRQ